MLAAQYNSYLHPLIVLLALPFSVSGALVALWVARQSLNIYSFIGMILLMGIVNPVTPRPKGRDFSKELPFITARSSPA